MPTNLRKGCVNLTSRSKLPIPYFVFISLLIFIISIYFAVLSVEYSPKKNNSPTTEFTEEIVTHKPVKQETTKEKTTNITTTTLVDKTTTVTTTKKAVTTTKVIKPTTTKTPTTTQKQTTTEKQTTTQSITTTNKQTTTQTSDNKKTWFTKADVELVAKILYEECRGVSSDTQKACVVWIICNRVDKGMGSSIQSVAKAKNQFDYNPYAPIRQDLYNLAQDVLSRWEREKNGEVNVGRVLPKDYLYFHGDGIRNYFRNAYQKPYKIWDYSLQSPYST